MQKWQLSVSTLCPTPRPRMESVCVILSSCPMVHQARPMTYDLSTVMNTGEASSLGLINKAAAHMWPGSGLLIAGCISATHGTDAQHPACLWRTPRPPATWLGLPGACPWLWVMPIFTLVLQVVPTGISLVTTCCSPVTQPPG